MKLAASTDLQVLSSKLSRGVLVWMAVAVLAACGGDSEQPRKMGATGTSPEVKKLVKVAKDTNARGAKGKVAQTPAMDEATRSKMLNDYWMWPEDGGPHNRLEDDYAACQEQIMNDPNRKRRMKPLEPLVLAAKCLQDKGWVPRK